MRLSPPTHGIGWQAVTPGAAIKELPGTEDHRVVKGHRSCILPLVLELGAAGGSPGAAVVVDGPEGEEEAQEDQQLRSTPSHRQAAPRLQYCCPTAAIRLPCSCLLEPYSSPTAALLLPTRQQSESNGGRVLPAAIWRLGLLRRRGGCEGARCRSRRGGATGGQGALLQARKREWRRGGRGGASAAGDRRTPTDPTLEHDASECRQRSPANT